MSYYTGIGGIADVATVAFKVTSDPALPEVVRLVTEIKTLTTSKGPSKPSAPSTEPGIGLSKIVTPLRGFVAYKKHPWIGPAFAGGIVLTIFALGVMAGKARRGKAP
jgi:hypothetical protein